MTRDEGENKLNVVDEIRNDSSESDTTRRSQNQRQGLFKRILNFFGGT